MDAWEKFRKNIIQNALLRPGERVLVAVSGGPDSVCLLHLFWRLRKTMALELYAVNFDHGLRPESKREADFVGALGRRLEIETALLSLPVGRHMRETGASLETAGRELRYEALAGLAREKKCTAVATGHHADDNAETVLMWLIRGSGPGGLAGIPMVRPLARGRRIIRPLLPVSRAEIMAYLKDQGLRYRVDRSNYDTDFTRNRIRHRLLPLLKTFNAGLVGHLFGLSRIVSEETAFLELLAARAMHSCVKLEKNRILFDLKRFFRYNKTIQNRVLKETLPENRTSAQIERVRELMQAPAGGTQRFSGSWVMQKKNNRFIFRKSA